jgi:hypothetical protein
MSCLNSAQLDGQSFFFKAQPPLAGRLRGRFLSPLTGDGNPGSPGMEIKTAPDGNAQLMARMLQQGRGPASPGIQATAAQLMR